MSGEAACAVEWAEVARQDLWEIADFIAGDSPTAALQVVERVEEKATALESMPLRGRVPPELLRFQLQIYREVQIPPYRLVYRVFDEKAVILGVFDGRRNLEDVVLGRLLSS